MPNGTARLGHATAPSGTSAGLRATIAWGGLTLFLVGWATVSLTNAAETLFHKRVGVPPDPLAPRA